MNDSAKKSRRPRNAAPAFFNPFPRYLQIRNILMRRLNDGLAPGDRFPTEHELCSEFGVSRETVREALSGLEHEGLIARHRGKGTFVARLPDSKEDERLTGLVEDFTELKLDTEATVIRSGVEKPPARIALVLHLGRGDTLYRIRRLRRVEGKLLACHDAYLPVAYGARLGSLDLSHTTLFGELRRTLSVKVHELYQHIDAMAADVDLAKVLEVELGAPLLVIRRAVTHQRDATPTMLFETYFRADRYYYSVHLHQEHGKTAGTRQVRVTKPGNRRPRPLDRR